MRASINRIVDPVCTRRSPSGFALVATLALMILLTMVAVGLLSLSAISLRGSSQSMARAEAQANARMALMIAIGELQKEMGPDMRISAESALFDTSKDSEKIDGVAQSHWLASYNSWGGWLNDTYTPPGGTGPLKISDTYTPQREKMFRRWLLSMPEGDEKKVDSPNDSAVKDEKKWVKLVGEGSLGQYATSDEDRVTRAYLVPIGKTGKHAWWIGPENHKARIDKAYRPRTLSPEAWQTAQGSTSEVGVGGLEGFEAALDTELGVSEKLITTQTLRPAKVSDDDVKEHFFDLTAHSRGVLASVRGTQKKDLSLLFEKNVTSLPSPYAFNSGANQEPSIRPMSKDLTAKLPKLPNRHFASWTNMRHYYRMYRSGSDATSTETGVSGALRWPGGKPMADFASSNSLSVDSPAWNGSNHYWRVPVLAKLTLIYSLVSKPAGGGKYSCLQYYNPVFTFWNPYNTQLVVPQGKMNISCKAYTTWPTNTKFYLNGIYKSMNGLFEASGFSGNLTSGGTGDIIFQPGELKVFSMKSTINSNNLGGIVVDLSPGFDPNVVVGDERTWTVGSGSTAVNAFSPAENPGVSYEFSCAQWGGGVINGNTPGAVYLDAKINSAKLPMTYSNDWLQRAPYSQDQTNTPITPLGQSNLAKWNFSDSSPKVVAYAQMAIKGMSPIDHPSIANVPSNRPEHRWAKDWRSRNWIQAPPFYFGSGMLMSIDDTIAHTQRLDCPYIVSFGETSSFGVSKLVGHIGGKAFLGSGANAYEQVTSAAMLELPTAPISSLAGFANMRINPGWTNANALAPNLAGPFPGNGINGAPASLYSAESKRVAYQSGVTGPGIGNSFMHPMLPRTDVYKFINNSISRDVIHREFPSNTQEVQTNAYCDYWDHVFLLNDALWDDYFVSSLADQKRGTNGPGDSLSKNVDNLLQDKELANSRYRYHSGGQVSTKIKTDLQGPNGYLKAAKHLVVDGMFNVNSTSVSAWQALFAGIRERQLVFRDASGAVKKISVPSDKRIALSRFDTEVSDQEMADAGRGVMMPDNISQGWSSVRFLDDDQLRKLAEECVEQVKRRGPFLNFSEFINRRLSNDDLGLMGALQSAIDYDDKAPDSKSINYRYKQAPGFMISKSDLGVAATGDIVKRFSTPEAAEGSRLAGIPGYVIQSDLLKPIANTLSVRDDTFRIRAYGEALDASGKVVIARAWCEAIVQRMPEYVDPANEADVSARQLDASGVFKDNTALKPINILFGRKFRIESFRWLNSAEV